MPTSTKPPGAPPTATVRLNNRGLPCTSAGRRNQAAIGSGLGNGGTPSPGHYERRKGCVQAEIRHHRMFREQWRRGLDHLLTIDSISRTDLAVGAALSTFSSQTGENVWPSHATIGARCKLSASTVQRSLAALRDLEMIEWDHRGVQIDGKPRATSNLYEFRIPEYVATAVGINRKRSRRLDEHQIPNPAHTVPDWQRDIDSRVASLVLVYGDDQYTAAEAELLDDLAGRPTEQLSFAAAALNERWRTAHPALQHE